MGVRWPGGAKSLQAVWEQLRQAWDCGVHVGEQQMARSTGMGPAARGPDWVARAYTLASADIEGFDCEFWRVNVDRSVRPAPSRSTISHS